VVLLSFAVLVIILLLVIAICILVIAIGTLNLAKTLEMIEELKILKNKHQCMGAELREGRARSSGAV
jgi:hypothetical protein